MHENSLVLMESLLREHALPSARKSVVDVGSQDINGTYRPLVESMGFASYTGVDIQDAENVDIVVPEDGPWPDIAGDVVISGQCVEHTRHPWEWIRHVSRTASPDGIVIVIAPWIWQIHRFPLDCWRILPDGMRALLEWGNLNVLDVGISDNDCWGIAGKEPSRT